MYCCDVFLLTLNAELLWMDELEIRNVFWVQVNSSYHLQVTFRRDSNMKRL